jgi:hypothetical protein
MTGSLPALPSPGLTRYRARDFYRVHSVQLAVVLALLNLEVAAIVVASSSGPAVVALLLFEAGSVWVGALLGERRAGRHWSAWASASAGDAYGKPPRRLWLAVGLGVVSAFVVLLVAKYWGTALCGSCLMGGAVAFGEGLGRWQSASQAEAVRGEVLLMEPRRAGSRRGLWASRWRRGHP